MEGIELNLVNECINLGGTKAHILRCLFMLCIVFPTYTRATNISICMEDSQWYPYVFVDQEDNPTGIQTEIVKEALRNLKIDYSIDVLPWLRCLLHVELGTVDAAMSASYSDSRAAFMNYPQGAKEAAEQGSKAEYRIAQTDYVITTLSSDPYEFQGNIDEIPQPVYVPRGFSIIEWLEEHNLEVDKSPKDYIGFVKLVARKKGCVISVLPFAKHMLSKDEFKDKLYISAKSVKSKSSFLGVSKKSKLEQSIVLSIWEEIKNVRENSFDKIVIENLNKTAKDLEI